MGALYFFPMHSVYAASERNLDKTEIDIEISSKDTLFNISNMKPGDWAPRSLIVKNSGSKDFRYDMHVRNDGDLKLFNELLLDINKGNETLYKGKLSAFSSLNTRQLESGNEEKLDITILFPEHLGNDYQGLESVFTLTFSADRKSSKAVYAMTQGQIDSGSSKTAGSHLPATATNIFTLMLVGSVLVASGIVMMLVRFVRRMRSMR